MNLTDGAGFSDSGTATSKDAWWGYLAHGGEGIGGNELWI